MTTIRYGSVLNVGDRAIVVGGDYVPRESRQRCLQDNKAQPSLCDEQRRQEASVKRRDRFDRIHSFILLHESIFM